MPGIKKLKAWTVKGWADVRNQVRRRKWKQWLTRSFKCSAHIRTGDNVLGKYMAGMWKKSLLMMVLSLNWTRKICTLAHKQLFLLGLWKGGGSLSIKIGHYLSWALFFWLNVNMPKTWFLIEILLGPPSRSKSIPGGLLYYRSYKVYK